MVTTIVITIVDSGSIPDNGTNVKPLIRIIMKTTPALETAFVGVNVTFNIADLKAITECKKQINIALDKMRDDKFQTGSTESLNALTAVDNLFTRILGDYKSITSAYMELFGPIETEVVNAAPTKMITDY